MNLTKQTQSESYQSILPGLMDRRHEVLMVLERFTEGATAEEVAQTLGIHPYLARPRLTELLEEGKIMVICKRRSPITGKNIAVYKVA